MSDETPVSTERRGVPVHLVVGAVLAIAVLIFVFQNTRKVRVEWLVFEGTAQLWIVLLLTAVVGIVAAELFSFALRRRRKQR
ncbi:MAG: lipopolysaccharide assembly protein LapA domain-containing protein [Acidimicrobiales bacterium]